MTLGCGDSFRRMSFRVVWNCSCLGSFGDLFVAFLFAEDEMTTVLIEKDPSRPIRWMQKFLAICRDDPIDPVFHSMHYFQYCHPPLLVFVESFFLCYRRGLVPC